MGITLLPPVCPLSAAVVESFRNGSEAMDSHDEFWEKYISNYYSERIGKFRNSLKRFQASLEKLKSETTRLKTEGESIVGVWTITSHPTDGQTNSVVVTFDAHGWGTARLTISGYTDPGEMSPFSGLFSILATCPKKALVSMNSHEPVRLTVTTLILKLPLVMRSHCRPAPCFAVTETIPGILFGPFGGSNRADTGIRADVAPAE
jgi:hypothetical protein